MRIARLLMTFCLIVFWGLYETNTSELNKFTETFDDLPHPQKLAEMLETHDTFSDDTDMQQADASKQVYGEELGENSGFASGLVTAGSFSIMASTAM